MTTYRITNTSSGHCLGADSAPVLPIRICVWASEVVAEYADWSPERYASLDELCRDHEMSATELNAREPN